MFAGFDFGTSNCAMAVMSDCDAQQIQLLPINQGKAFMPSTLYAIERELICDFVALNIKDASIQQDYMSLRQNQLAQARRVRLEEDIPASEQSIFVGQEAFDQYLSLPSEGYFVKSVKSFLGASGLRPEFIAFFEDIVAAMMLNIKQRSEQCLGKSIEHVVIGRPVNFQGVNAQESNRRAIDILTLGAKRAGFKSVEFLYEPLAAGLDFEAQLTQDKTVLVVDVGGGTTDCAMVRMGPSFRKKQQRNDDFLGHSGERVGGNDFDIQLAGRSLMPLFGMDSMLKNGLPMPTQVFWNAVSTNNVAAQTTFNSLQTQQSLERFMLDTQEPNLLSRFIDLRQRKQNYQLVRSAEQAKIALSDQSQCQLDLGYIEAGLQCDISRAQFAQAVEPALASMVALIDEAIKQAACRPDCVYITGGSAKSELIRHAVEQQLGRVEIVDGDHFGSVTKGLTVWAQRLFA